MSFTGGVLCSILAVTYSRSTIMSHLGQIQVQEHLSPEFLTLEVIHGVEDLRIGHERLANAHVGARTR